MSTKEKRLTMEFSLRWLIDLFLTAAILSLLSVPIALARENQNSVTAMDQTQPVVPATATPEPEKAMAQALDSFTAGSSIDFLMGETPLMQSATNTASPSIPVPETPVTGHASRGPVTLQVLQGTVLEEADEVALLVAEQCSQKGDTRDGTTSCERVYSNGHHATVLTQNANEGDELKRQTIIEEFDGNNVSLYKKTIRHRVDYNYLNDQKAKEKELFDIIYQPSDRKATRELMVYEYFLDTGKARSLSWTQYKQIANEPKAGLVYHALLRYGDDGSPERGLAEKWSQGKKAETFINWSRGSKGFATLDEETWGQWEGWIRNIALQAYLP